MAVQSLDGHDGVVPVTTSAQSYREGLEVRAYVLTAKGIVFVYGKNPLEDKGRADLRRGVPPRAA